MKKFRCLTAILLIATMFVSFNACSSDDDDNNDDSQSGKRLSKVVKYDSDNNIDDSFSFRYSDGKLSNIIFEGEDADKPIAITYSDKNVSITGEINQTLQLNNAGFAESGTFKVDKSPYRFNCEYSNGYLTKVTYPDSDDNTRIEIKYDNNGNISTACRYSDNEVKEYKFTLSNYTAKGKNMFVLGDLFGRDEELDLFWPAYYAGFLGKDYSMLLSKVEYKGESDYEIIEFDYTFDKDGYVETMTAKEKWGFNAGGNGEDTKRLSFTYE